jgi:hypothetical protein
MFLLHVSPSHVFPKPHAVAQFPQWFALLKRKVSQPLFVLEEASQSA